VYNFTQRHLLQGPSLEGPIELFRQVTTSENQETYEIGTGKISLQASKFDPWAEVEVEEVLGASYEISTKIMQYGTILTTVDPKKFGPYFFKFWDLIPE
ncbi:MAG: hypothetical protein ACFFBD_21995, partial [Candidatus Hodarchaeota archaeon]